MHLKKWFNFKYLYQNFKKSKSLLLFLLCIIPFINLWMVGINLLNLNYILDFGDLSNTTAIIAFIFPVILAFILYGFVFRRNEVDFVISKPITRRQIFGSNLVGGIVFILLVILINTLGFILLSLLTKLYIPMGAVIDYFIYWFITYVFIFIISIFAISIAGNIMSSLIVIALILLLYPTFTLVEYNARVSSGDTYLVCKDSHCMPEENYCNGDALCLEELDTGEYLYAVNDSYNATLNSPINYFNVGFSTKSIVKTIILAIIYLIAAYYLFKKKKMENSEIGFQNKYLYKVVKILTFIPVTYLAYTLLVSNSIFFIIGLIICVSYYYIYDLVVKKEITNIIGNIGEVIIVGIIFMGCYYLLNITYENNPKYLNIPDEVMVEYYDADLSYRYVVLIDDLNLINKLIKPENMANSDNYNNITIYLNEKKYMTKFISDNLDQELDNYANTNNLKDKFTRDNIIHITSSTNPRLVIPCNTKIKEMIVDYLEHYPRSNPEINNYISIYKYEDHQLKDLAFNIMDNLELLNYVKNYYNEAFLQNIETVVYVNDEELMDSFSDVFMENRVDLMRFLQEHKYDELTNDVLILYSGLDRFFVNREVFLMEYNKYVDEEQNS